MTRTPRSRSATAPTSGASKPGIYGLPENPKLPQKNIFVDSLLSIGSAVLVGVGALMAFRSRGAGKGD